MKSGDSFNENNNEGGVADFLQNILNRNISTPLSRNSKSPNKNDPKKKPTKKIDYKKGESMVKKSPGSGKVPFDPEKMLQEIKKNNIITPRKLPSQGENKESREKQLEDVLISRSDR